MKKLIKESYLFEKYLFQLIAFKCKSFVNGVNALEREWNILLWQKQFIYLG